MSLTAESTKSRVGYLAMLGGVLMLIDTLWGSIAVLAFDWSSPNEAAAGISFVIGLPTYVLDFWSKRRVVLFLPALFLFRWLAVSIGSASPTFIQPWTLNALVIAAAVLLQASKLRRHARAAGPTGSAQVKP